MVQVYLLVILHGVSYCSSYIFVEHQYVIYDFSGYDFGMIFHIFTIESKAFEKSINRSVAGRLLDFTPFSIRRIVKMCSFVDLFVRKLF